MILISISSPPKSKDNPPINTGFFNQKTLTRNLIIPISSSSEPPQLVVSEPFRVQLADNDVFLQFNHQTTDGIDIS